MAAPGAEGEADEAASCPGRPAPGQRGESEGAAETQGGGERKEEEGGGGGGQVSVNVTYWAFVCVWCMQHIIPHEPLFESAFAPADFLALSLLLPCVMFMNASKS